MIQYRRDVVKFFKDSGFAIGEISEIKSGETYFSNSFSIGESGFQITKLLTDKEHWALWSKSNGLSGDSVFVHTDDIAWFEATDASGEKSMHSLTDCNVGACYNPWMIFKTKQSLEAYEKLQVVTYERDYLDEAYDYSDSEYGE